MSLVTCGVHYEVHSDCVLHAGRNQQQMCLKDCDSTFTFTFSTTMLTSSTHNTHKAKIQTKIHPQTSKHKTTMQFGVFMEFEESLDLVIMNKKFYLTNDSILSFQNQWQMMHISCTNGDSILLNTLMYLATSLRLFLDESKALPQMANRAKTQ